MKTIEQIKNLKLSGMSNDLIYQEIAGIIGLYSVAFFGAKGTKAQKQRLSRIWKQIVNN
jgi:hypothetical protein